MDSICFAFNIALSTFIGYKISDILEIIEPLKRWQVWVIRFGFGLPLMEIVGFAFYPSLLDLINKECLIITLLFAIVIGFYDFSIDCLIYMLRKEKEN